MSTHTRTLQVALAASIGIGTLCCESCRAQGGAEKAAPERIPDYVSVQSADGPYSYKSAADLIAVVGFVTGVSGSDVIFRYCSGTTKTVKRNELTRIQRNCPPGSPVGPWIFDEVGKIVPLPGYSPDSKVYFGMEKAGIDLDALPVAYKQRVKSAKPGEWVAISYPTDKGQPILSIIGKPAPE